MILTELVHHEVKQLLRLVPLIPRGEDYYFRYQRAYDHPAEIPLHLPFALTLRHIEVYTAPDT